jgi:simple sugar transport system permease protein
MTETVLISLLAMSVRMAVPYWFSSLGEMYSQKSGVLNIGLEGVITVGAFVSFMVAFYSGSCWLGLGVAACVVLGLIYGLLVIYLGMDQPITGIALNLLILGSTSFLYRLVFGTTAIAPTSSSTFDKVAIPLLSKIPWLGEILFHQYNAFLFRKLL